MTNHETFKAFCDGATGGKNSSASLLIMGDTLYSYGFHWPLAHRVGTVMVVNRDRASVTTSKQTSQFIQVALQHLYTVKESNLSDMVDQYGSHAVRG